MTIEDRILSALVDGPLAPIELEAAVVDPEHDNRHSWAADFAGALCRLTERRQIRFFIATGEYGLLKDEPTIESTTHTVFEVPELDALISSVENHLEHVPEGGYFDGQEHLERGLAKLQEMRAKADGTFKIVRKLDGPKTTLREAGVNSFELLQVAELTPDQQRAVERGVPLAVNPDSQANLNHFFDPDGDGDL